MKKILKKSTAYFCTIFSVLALLSLSFFAYAAESDFEKSISDFPESYKVHLRALHEQYPSWSFEPFFTGLDWETVIDNEHDDYALVYESDAARIFKSLDADDYDAESDSFYYKDGSFVAASRTAVEYFMDPRNFLDKGGIFQFELLNYTSSYTVEMVESVLSGSFMHNSKMTYVDSSGKKYTDTLTYAQAIFNAGKAYNINPCFIASKILNEVGSKGSESVSGTNAKYPGIYNFYNIGATDGAGAVERGLLWARGGNSGSTSYSRPWNTPYKSILGGAEFLAEEYIAAGQYTGYLQRFNVNKDSDYNLYTHQYMSNLTGALSQGYSIYGSYRDMKMLNLDLTFSIPIYENMSDTDNNGRLVGAESTEQYGEIGVSYTSVRQGPSIDHNRVTDAYGSNIYLERGDEVKILGKVDTDAYYYEEILSEPYWYEVSFNYGGKAYKGFIPGNYINIKTAVHTAPGIADISFIKSDGVKSHLASSDPTMVKIIDDNTVEFLKNGKVSLYIYDSVGHFEEILFKVGNYASYYSKNLSVNVSGNSLSASVDKVDKAISCGFSVGDMNGNFKKAVFSTATTATFNNLRSGTGYTVFAQNCFGKYVYTKAVSKSVVTKPQKVQKLDYNSTQSGSYVLSWQGVENATGYQVLSYNESTGKTAQVKLVPFGTNSCTLTSSQAKAENFTVRAYCQYEKIVSFGDYSPVISLSDKPSVPSNVKVSSVTASGYLLSWNGNKNNDGYEVYACRDGESKYSLVKDTAQTSLNITGLSNADIRAYRIRAYKNTASGKVYSSATSPVYAITVPAVTSKLTVKNGSYRVIAQWNEVKGATGYNLIYRKAGGELKTVSVKATSCEIKNLDCNSTYYFAVSAFISRDKTSVTGSRTSAVTAKTLPAIPQNIQLVSAGCDYIDIRWSADKTLDAYRAYAYDSNGKLISSNTVKKSNADTMRLSSLQSMTAYRVILKGYKLIDGKYIASEKSEVLTVRTASPIVKNIKSLNVTDKSFRLSWDKLSGATAYKVYLLTQGGEELKATVTDNFCDVDFMPESTVGRFYITALFEKDSTTVEGDKSQVFTASCLPSQITGITVKASSNAATVSWDKVNDAYCYRVYILKNGSYVLESTTQSTSVTVKGLTDCTTNYVAVRAYFKNTTGVLTGKHTVKKFYTLPLSVEKIVQSKKTDTSYTLTWEASSKNVNRYYLYRYNQQKKSFELLGSTAKTTCTLKDLTPGTQQRYAVIAAVVKDGKKIVSSKYTYHYDCGTYLSKTENLRQAAASETALKIAWDEVEGATAYNVYCYDYSKKAFKLLGRTEATTATLKKLSSGTEYAFRVNAVREFEGDSFIGYYSDVLYAATK